MQLGLHTKHRKKIVGRRHPPAEGRRQSGPASEKTTLSRRPQERRGHREEAILGS